MQSLLISLILRYGEEWEAYRDSGIITLLGLAFSRDQAKKVYIQDVMRNSLQEVVDAFISKKGSFYLCGPV
jgi:sulfite reductase (NADPH) flavoprotein alpha-component